MTIMKACFRAGLNVRNHGIGPAGMNESSDKLWILKTLEETVDDIFGGLNIDLLIIDMNGGEFTLFPNLLRLANETRFTQLSVRGHVWSEENENFRQLYWNLRQLESYGYLHQYGQVELPRYDIVYVRE
ncbi:unnamed protein product [Strongylus vulgaris]|uniref:Methyltransferase FkbM domain-containing protein n=1 Tax=Strongylus vulgaris TaxID=40348 RepID=A0A3P7JVR0_STRVU|nr:unnamed protein product [Strongylus vulgaris]